MMTDDSLSHTTRGIVIVFVAVVLIAAVLIPVLLDVVGDEGKHIDPGDTFSYSPTVNIEGATFTFSGTAMEYLEVSEDGKSVSGTFPDIGTFTLTVTASTGQPTQSVSQTYELVVSETDYTKIRGLFLVIPTFVIVGLIVLIARWFMMNGGGGGDVGGLSGESVSGSLDGFKDRFSGGYGKR